MFGYQRLRFAAILALGAIAWGPSPALAAPTTAPAASAPAELPVLVIGAGLAGLTTAYRLKQAGLESLVLEASPHVGGRIRSAHYGDGLAAEAGLQEYWDNNPAMALAQELKLPLSEAGTAYCSVMLGGKLFPCVEDTDAQYVSKVLGPAGYKGFQAWDRRMESLYQASQQRPLPADVQALTNLSFGAWLDQQKELTLRAKQFVRTTEFATDADRISALEGVLEWKIYSGAGAQCRVIKGGNQQLPEAIAARLGRDHVLLGMQVTSIIQHPDWVEVTARDTGSFEVRRFRARRVVSTIPLFRLKDVQLSPPLTPVAERAIAAQDYGTYFSAHVVVDKAAEPYWHLQGVDISPILTGGPLSVVYAASTSKESGLDLLDIVAKGRSAQHFNDPSLTANQIAGEVTAGLEKLWPGVSRHIKSMSFVHYPRRTIASWGVGRSRLDPLSDALRQPQGRLYLAGDFTEGTHSDGASWSAVRVVQQICKAEHVQPPAQLIPAGLVEPTQDRP